MPGTYSVSETVPAGWPWAVLCLIGAGLVILAATGGFVWSFRRRNE
jgi:hypothetical protein